MNIDKYEIIKLLGNGNMGSVYLVNDVNLNKSFAMKYVDKNSFYNSIEVESIRNECTILNNINDRRFPYVVDFIDNNDYCALVMEYIEGISFNKYLRENVPISIDLVNDFMNQLCDIFQYLHSFNPPIVYRDLKPSNIMLTSDNQLKLIDFGASLMEYGFINESISVGTYGYSSPEQLSGCIINETTDIYSLGALMSYMLTGIEPSLPPFEVVLSDNYYANKIIKCCTNYNVKERYKNVNLIKNDLKKISLKYYDLKKIFTVGLYYTMLFFNISFVFYIFEFIYKDSCDDFMVLIALLSIIINYYFGKYIEKRFYKSSFIRKRCVNILFTEKRDVFL